MAARTLAEELEWRDGRLQLEVLKGAGYLFENHTGSRLFYKVTSIDGQWLGGDATLPSAPLRGTSSVRYFALVHFDDGVFENG